MPRRGKDKAVEEALAKLKQSTKHAERVVNQVDDHESREIEAKKKLVEINKQLEDSKRFNEKVLSGKIKTDMKEAKKLPKAPKVERKRPLIDAEDVVLGYVAYKIYKGK